MNSSPDQNEPRSRPDLILPTPCLTHRRFRAMCRKMLGVAAKSQKRRHRRRGRCISTRWPHRRVLCFMDEEWNIQAGWRRLHRAYL